MPRLPGAWAAGARPPPRPASSWCSARPRPARGSRVRLWPAAHAGPGRTTPGRPARCWPPTAPRRPAARRDRAAHPQRGTAGRAGATFRRADPGPHRAVFAFRPPSRALAVGTACRRREEPGGRSWPGTGARARARRSSGHRIRLRSPGRRSARRRSRGRRRHSRRSSGCCSGAGRPEGSRRRAAQTGPAGAGQDGQARGGRPAGRPVAAATGRSTRRPPARSPRSSPAHPSPRRRVPDGTHGGRPGAVAWAGHTRRGPGRRRHVPPGTS